MWTRFLSTLLGRTRWHAQVQEVQATRLRAGLAARRAAAVAAEVHRLNAVLDGGKK